MPQAAAPCPHIFCMPLTCGQQIDIQYRGHTVLHITQSEDQTLELAVRLHRCKSPVSGLEEFCSCWEIDRVGNGLSRSPVFHPGAIDLRLTAILDIASLIIRFCWPIAVV